MLASKKGKILWVWFAKLKTFPEIFAELGNKIVGWKQYNKKWILQTNRWILQKRENQYNHSIMQKILPILINERDLEDISAKMEVTYVPNDVGNN